MKTFKTLLIAGLLVASALPLLAQQKRTSPHETISAIVDGNRITVTYGRPYTKSPNSSEMRKIWGGLVPYDKVWRTGADEATVFITQKPVQFGDVTVPAGAYTLWTLPAENGPTKLIINKQIGQWGVGPGSYDEKQDVARIDLSKNALEKSADQFTISVGKNNGGGGLLKLSWENVEYSAAFTVAK